LTLHPTPRPEPSGFSGGRGSVRAPLRIRLAGRLALTGEMRAPARSGGRGSVRASLLPGIGGDAPHRARHTELEQDPERRAGLAQVDLGRPRPAVLEDDRRLADPAADGLTPEEDLLLEGIAARPNLVEVDLGQLADAVAAEGPAVIPAGQSEHQPGVGVDS